MKHLRHARLKLLFAKGSVNNFGELNAHSGYVGKALVIENVLSA